MTQAKEAKTTFTYTKDTTNARRINAGKTETGPYGSLYLPFDLFDAETVEFEVVVRPVKK